MNWSGIGELAIVVMLNIVGFVYNYARVTAKVEAVIERISELERQTNDRLNRIQEDIREIRGVIFKSHGDD